MNSVITRGLEKNNIKKKKSPKKNSLKNEYSEFLKKSKGISPKISSRRRSMKKKINIVENKKNPIFIKTNNQKKSPKKNISPKKTLNPEPKKTEPKKTEPKKTEPKKTEPKKTEPKNSNVSVKSKRRFSKKSKKRKLDKKHTKTRKISFRCYPQKDKNIADVIEKANKLSEEEMKKDLLSNGIEIKGTKNKLLKDIYMFSSLGGIKIQKE
mgnify:CR=1 FL=1